MRKFLLLLVCATLAGPAAAVPGDSLNRGFSGKRVYLDLMWTGTFYRGSKVTGQGYPGVTFKPDFGFDAGIGFLIPLPFKRSSRYFHLSTHICSGITPIRMQFDLDRDDFRTSMDHDDVLSTNTVNIAMRQGICMYSRATASRLNRYGIGIGVRASEHIDMELGYANAENETELHMDIDYTGSRNAINSNWAGAVDVQFVRGWQWLSRYGTSIGIDLVLNLSMGEKPEYRYRLYSDFYEVAGTFVQRTNFIGVRFSTSFTGNGKHHVTGVRFPG